MLVINVNIIFIIMIVDIMAIATILPGPRREFRVECVFCRATLGRPAD